MSSPASYQCGHETPATKKRAQLFFVFKKRVAVGPEEEQEGLVTRDVSYYSFFWAVETWYMHCVLRCELVTCVPLDSRSLSGSYVYTSLGHGVHAHA